VPAFSDEGQSLRGDVEIGYRDADVSGAGDKYREDVNLSDGAVRLFQLSVDYDPEDGEFFDELSLEARGLGGEPHSSARFGLSKAGRYELKLSYRSSDYFYRDAGYFFRDGGDLHTWNADRTFFNVDAKIQATDRIKLRFGANLAKREGGSTTSRPLQQDVFVLSRPVDQTAETLWAAVDFRVGWTDFTLEQRLISQENRWQSTASATDGELASGAFLDDYRQSRIEDSDTPITRVSVRGRPHERVRFSLGYARADSELDYDVDGDWSGLDFTDAAFSTTLTNTGDVERTSDLLDLDLSIGLRDDLDLLLDFSSRSYDQDGTIDSLEVQSGGATSGTFSVQGDLRNELDLETYGITLDWQPTETVSVAAGAGLQERTKSFQLSGPEVETQRTLYRAGVRWRPNKTWNLRLDLEQGDEDDPLTSVSATSTERVRLRADVRPVEGLALSFRFLDESKENDLSTPLGLPTDDTPPADEVSLAEFDVTTWALELGWSRGSLDLSAGYATSELDFDAHIVFVTDFVFVPVFDITTTRQSTAYEADQDVIHASVRYVFGERWDVGAQVSLADNSGSFPVESRIYGADARYRFGRGLHLRVAYRSYDYDENNPFAGDPASPTPDVNDYEADLLTAAVGYRF
jgi:hypothetical protein